MSEAKPLADGQNEAPEQQGASFLHTDDMLTALTSLLASQASEQGLKEKELSLRKQAFLQNSAYAHEALKAQAEDRRQHRDLFLKVTRDRYRFVLLALLLVFFFMAWLVSHQQTELAKDMLKLGLGFAAGAITGFFAGKNRPATHSGGSNSADR